jgi:hypothetical protein
MRYRLRTLLILLAIGPPIVAWYIWPRVQEAYFAWQERQREPIPRGVQSNRGRFTVINSGNFVYLWNAQLDIGVDRSSIQASISRKEAEIAELEVRMEVLDGESKDEIFAQLTALQSQVAQLEAQLAQAPRRLNWSRAIDAPPPPLLSSPGVECAMLHDGTLIK